MELSAGGGDNLAVFPLYLIREALERKSGGIKN